MTDFAGRLPKTPLRQWQQSALQAWDKSGRRGIVAAATGTGKTLFALHAIARFWDDRSRVIVVVPKQVLQEQWISLFRSSMRLGPGVLGTIGGTKNFNLNHRVVVAVIDSARERLTDPVTHWRQQGDRVMLVVDECHWAGSEASAGIFAAGFDATLGLSATPERSDDGLEELLIPHLGPVLFRYPLRDALDDGLLAPLHLLNVYFDLTATERNQYNRLGDQIRSARNALQLQIGEGPGWDARLAAAARSDPRARSLQALLLRRRRVVAESNARMTALETVLGGNDLSSRRTLIFNESIAQAEAVASLLQARGTSFELEHSRLPQKRRLASLRRFAAGTARVLIAVRALDEGVDVPAADQAIVVSGTTTPRQRIQRIGRVTRLSGGRADVISLLGAGTAEQFYVGDLDPDLVGPQRVRYWSLGS